LKKYVHIIIKFIYTVLFVNTLQAQDIHFSQYYNNPLQLNPAQAGLFSEDIRFIANSKLQWANVPVNYTTFSASYDHKHYPKQAQKGVFATGGLLSYDRAGDSHLTTTHLAGNAAYVKRIGELNLISIGLQAGIRHRGANYDDLYFDRQFNGEKFNAVAPTGEKFDNRSILAIDFGIGINYRFQLKDKRTRFDFGAAIFHPHEPKADFLEKNLRLPSRKTFYVLTNVKAAKKLDVLVYLAGQNQGVYNEFYISNLYRFYLKQSKYSTKAIQIGLQYRLAERSDALIPTVEFLTDQYRLGFNYDVTISRFQAANNSRGGPEVSFQYLITNVKKVKSSKACPIF
jgi:type IX secretion system PorP/SprF family membrane protein